MPTTAEVINASFRNRTDMLNSAAARKDTRQKAALSQYEKFRNHLAEGATRIQSTIEGSETPIQFGEETRRMMFSAARQADMMARSLGLPETNLQTVESAFGAKTGTQIAQTAGRLSAAETVANVQAGNQAGLPAARGAAASGEQVATAQANNAAGLPAIEGTAAGQRANAELAATDQTAIGRAEAAQQNAQVAATDTVAAGEADAQQEIASREATVRFLANEQGIAQGTPQYQELQRQVHGAPKEEVDMSKIGIAANITGLDKLIQSGQPVPEDVFQNFVAKLKEMNVSNDLIGQLLQTLGGGQPVTSVTPAAPVAPGGDLPPGITESDMAFVMDKYKLTREQALQRYAERQQQQ